METEIQTLLDSVADLRKKANVNACFGKPVTAEGRTVIPAAEVAYEFELGAKAATAGAGESAGGGGMNVRPLAIVEVTPTGTRVESIIDEQKVALAGVLLIGWVAFWLARALIRIFGRQE